MCGAAPSFTLEESGLKVTEQQKHLTDRREFIATATAPVTLVMIDALVPTACNAETTITTAAPVQTAGDRVTVSVAGGALAIQFYTDRTIRVTMAPTGHPVNHESLAVIAGPRHVHVRTLHEANVITMETAHARVLFDRRDETLSFQIADGSTVLRELAPNPRTFESVDVGGTSTFTTTQRFALADDQAFYGLGQHQQGVMNYQGTSVHLEQQNMHVAVPVMLSSAGYGLFWDNPAITDFEFGTSSVVVTPSSVLWHNGVSGGLLGEYYEGQNFNRLVGSRIDEHIDFNWQGQPPISGLTADNFSVRWTGELHPPATGDYVLQVVSDDGSRLYLDGKLLADNWHVQPATAAAATVHLVEGQVYQLRIEYFQATRDAVMQFNWAPPNAMKDLQITSQAGNSIDYYFMAGSDLDDVINEYRRLTGVVPMFGKWSWGFWQCKNHYETQEEVLGVAAEYRSMDIPIDGIIQDWMYWVPSPWGSNKFDPTRYPDPRGMIAQLHAEILHFMISVWGKFDPGSSNYALLASKGYLLKSHCSSRYYDPFNPQARKLYWHLMKTQLFDLGVDGWWLDASEPELCGAWGEFASTMTHVGPGALVYNAYPLMHTTSVYEGQRGTTSKKRVMILTRSAWAGQQRNGAVTWSGDITGNWPTLANQIPAGLNFSMSGIPYWNTDIGGYISGNPKDPAYAELFVRWFQFGSFCPMFRVHGVNYGKEMWKFAPEYREILQKFNQLRYHLLPYIYSVAWRVTAEGYSMMRALVMDFRYDPAVHNIGNQFMFGPALMVSPVVQEGAESRSVYLAAGVTWYDFWTGEHQRGGTTVTVKAPLDSMPLFVRAGSILPIGATVPNTETDDDPLEIRVYPGDNGRFRLYEDEGDGYDYEHGVYSTIELHWDDHLRQLTIGARHGHFPGMKAARTFHVLLVTAGRGTGISQGNTYRNVAYHGGAVTVTL